LDANSETHLKKSTVTQTRLDASKQENLLLNSSYEIELVQSQIEPNQNKSMFILVKLNLGLGDIV